MQNKCVIKSNPMINIQWSQFEQNQQAKDISFESFCYQVAYIKYKDFGFLIISIIHLALSFT